MTLDKSHVCDEMTAAAGYSREGTDDRSFVRGHGVAEVYGPDGELKQSVSFTNIITQTGEQRYGEAGGLDAAASVAKPTGMALGTGTTTAAKTGAGAAIVTGITGSAIALSGNPSSALSPSNYRRLTYVCTWNASTVQNQNGIAEVVLQNGTATTLPTNATSQSSTISRALLSPVVNKGSADTLTITWNHDIGSG